MHGGLSLNNLARTSAVNKSARRTSKYMLSTAHGKKLISSAHKKLDRLEKLLGAESALRGKLRPRKSHLLDIQKRISQLGKIKKKAERDLLMAQKIKRLTRNGGRLKGVRSMSPSSRAKVYNNLPNGMKPVYQALMFEKKFTRTKGGSPRSISTYIKQLEGYIRMSKRELASIERRLKKIYNGRNILNGL